MEMLSVKAKSLGLEEREVPRDGNCQFHSFSQSINSMNKDMENHVELDHIIMRHYIVAWLRANSLFQLNKDDPDTTLSQYLDGDDTWEVQ